MDEKQIKEIVDGVAATISNDVPVIVDAAVEKKVSELMAKSASEMDEVKAELKAMKVQKASAPEVKTAFTQTAIVSVMKSVIFEKVTSEKAFNEVVDRTMKTMTEGVATEGAELVFDQFEADVLRVINTFEIINDVRILNLVKGDKLTLPKATNGITTYYTDEGVAYTASEPDTSSIVWNIKKITTLTDLSEELLDDTMTIPDLYQLIVDFVGESQAEFLEEKIVSGALGSAIVGITKVAGTNKVALAATKTSADLTDDQIVQVITSIKRKFGRNKRWLMSQYIHGRIAAIKTADGYPLYPEMRSENPVLMGSKVILSEASGLIQDAGDDVADAVIAVYGSLERYFVVRRKGVTMEQGYYGDNWKKDIRSLKSNQRASGNATFPEAFTLLVNGPVA